MADRSGYIGRAPGDSSITVARQTFSPTGVTTDFTFASGYTVGYLDLFLNGTKLIEGVDYNATDSSTISLVSAAINGDVLEGVAYKAFNLGDARRIGIQSGGALLGNVDTLNFVGTGNTFALNGGTIDVSISAGAGGTWSNYDSNAGVTTTKKVKISNNLEVTGVTTSTGGFVGNLTGNASGSSGSCTGNSATATVATNAQGLTGTPDITVRNIVGVAATFTGVLTYEDVTNIDSIGIVTARTGIEFGSAGVGGTISALGHGEFVGVVTASALDAAISFWTLGADGSNHYTFTGPGDLSGDTDPDLQLIRGQKYIFKNRSGGHPFRIQSTPNGSAGAAYNDGVTNNDAGNGTDLIFDVPFDAPSILYYQCTAHGSMGGPIYVGSSSGDDVNVGAAVTIYASSGIVSATSYYGDGSNLTGVESGVGNFVASGNIPNGDTVIIKADGTVGIITQTVSTDPDIGNATVFESASVSAMGAAFDSTNNKVVIAYEDTGNSNYGTAIVGTVSGDDITFGTAVVFSAANSTQDPSVVYDSSNEKIVITYRNDGNSNYGTAIVGTVSGTNISFGSAVVFNDAASYMTSGRSATFDSNSNKVVITYRNDGNSGRGTAIVGTVSGTSISFGSDALFETGSTSNIGVTFDSSNNKVVVAYQDGNDGDKGKVAVGTVSGTSISFGSPVVFESGVTTNIVAVFDSSNNKVVIAYRDSSNSAYGTAIVGTVSGTSISFGTAVVFESASVEDVTATFDSSNNKVVIAYRDEDNSNYGTAIVGTVSGTSISFGTAVVFESAYTLNCKSTFDSNRNKVVITYRDNGNSNYGTARVFGAVSLVTNLTTENYIGIAAEAISNGATGKVNIVGGINTGQTGLTTARTHYVQANGTLGTSAGEPSVIAGTSISNTSIVVKG